MSNFYLDIKILGVLLDILKRFKRSNEAFVVRDLDLREFASHSPESIGIYIHYPFCKTICSYCPFNKTLYRKELEQRYIETLLQEIKLISTATNKIPINRVYIGGGTPSLLSDESLEKIITVVKGSYQIENNARIGIEAKAQSLTTNKMRLLRKLGFDRISFGVQTFESNILRKIARTENLEEAKEKIEMAKQYFKTVNIDLMFGLPYQSLSIWENDLQEAINLGINHITTYPLLLMKNTPLYHLVKNGKMRLPNGRDKYFSRALEFLVQHGFTHRVVWTFTKALSKEATYSTTEQTDEYLGFGAGAYTYFKNFLKINTYSISQYIDTFNSGNPKAFYKYIDQRARTVKAFIFELLWMELNKSEFERRFNINLNKEFGKVISTLKWFGILEEENGYLRVTKKGKHFLSLITEYYIVGGSQSKDFLFYC